MSEKKEKKTAEKTEADIQAGIAPLAEAILALDEPAEIAEVPEEEHPHGKKEAADKDPRTREEKLMALMEKGKKAGKLTLKEISDVLEPMELSTDQEQKFYPVKSSRAKNIFAEDRVILPTLAIAQAWGKPGR